MDALRTIFNSNYNSLQAKVTKRFSGKTYYRCQLHVVARPDQRPGRLLRLRPEHLQLNSEYGRAADDRNNVLTLDGVYELPWYRDQKGFVGHVVGGWELVGYLRGQLRPAADGLGQPATTTAYNLPGNVASVFNGRTNTGYITDNAGLSVFGNTNAGLRLNQLGNPNNGYGAKIHNKGYNSLWFYTGAFAAAPPSQTSVAPTAKARYDPGPWLQPPGLSVSPQLPHLRASELPVPHGSVQRAQPHERADGGNVLCRRRNLRRSHRLPRRPHRAVRWTFRLLTQSNGSIYGARFGGRLLFCSHD